jgi:D-3-phosphoglycerate dehydrogenase / 2-oxoglutarate reductase
MLIASYSLPVVKFHISGSDFSMKQVLVTARLFGYLSDSAFEPFKRAGIRVVDNPCRGRMPTEQQLIELLSDVDGIIPGNEKMSAKVLACAPRLKVISRFGTGIDNIDLQAAADRGIVVTRVPEVNGDAVADMTFGLLLSIARQIPVLREKVRTGQWPLVVGSSVYGKTLGIIGLGHIGKKVASRAAGFGMTLLAHEPNPDYAFVQEHHIGLTSLEDLLAASDFVTLHCPLTPETRHTIGEREISLMKPTAFIINASRGGVIDEQSLYQCLKSGRIAGAAVDVFEKEPAENSPLPSLDNFIGTPHIAFCTTDVLARMEGIAAQNMIDVLAGKLPEHTVGLSRYAKGPRR